MKQKGSKAKEQQIIDRLPEILLLLAEVVKDLKERLDAVEMRTVATTAPSRPSRSRRRRRTIGFAI